jgi:hypothetical protein
VILPYWRIDARSYYAGDDAHGARQRARDEARAIAPLLVVAHPDDLGDELDRHWAETGAVASEAYRALVEGELRLRAVGRSDPAYRYGLN